MTNVEKNSIKHDIVERLAADSSVRKVVIFGSFLTSENPHDVDIAVFSAGAGDYLSLAMQYRRELREVSKRISLDVIPIRMPCEESSFLREINSGETVYEKGN